MTFDLSCVSFSCCFPCSSFSYLVLSLCLTSERASFTKFLSFFFPLISINKWPFFYPFLYVFFSSSMIDGLLRFLERTVQGPWLLPCPRGLKKLYTCTASFTCEAGEVRTRAGCRRVDMKSCQENFIVSVYVLARVKFCKMMMKGRVDHLIYLTLFIFCDLFVG